MTFQYDFSYVDNELQKLEDENLLRTIRTHTSPNGPWVELDDGHRVLQFASNNYLGLSNHPDLIKVSNVVAEKFGIGSTGSRLLTGTSKYHSELEKKAASFQESQTAVYFSSGYSANIGVLSTLIKPEDVVFSDSLNHASIIDGIRLSGAQKVIYEHNNLNDLKDKLLKHRSNSSNAFIVTDSVFSVDGNIVPLEVLANLCEEFNCIPILDEAHSVGVFGNRGEGIVLSTGVAEKFPIRIITCSKALGAEGAICVCPQNIGDLLRNRSRPFMFSTSPTVSNAAIVMKSIALVSEGNWRREKLWANAKLLHNSLKKNIKLTLSEFKSPIICVYFKNLEEAISINTRLFEECHVWGALLRYPSSERPCIRLTPIATHSEEDISHVAKAFEFLAEDITIEPLFASS